MSDCGVCIGGGDYGGNDFDMGPNVSEFDEKCSECNEVIPAGAEYESAHWNDDDDRPCSAQTCLICAEIAWAFSCNSRVYFNLWEDIHEQVFPEFSLACIEKLKTPEAKRLLQHKWMEWKGLLKYGE